MAAWLGSGGSSPTGSAGSSPSRPPASSPSPSESARPSRRRCSGSGLAGSELGLGPQLRHCPRPCHSAGTRRRLDRAAAKRRVGGRLFQRRLLGQAGRQPCRRLLNVPRVSPAVAPRPRHRMADRLVRCATPASGSSEAVGQHQRTSSCPSSSSFLAVCSLLFPPVPAVHILPFII